MNTLKSFFTGKYILWILLAIPGFMMSINYAKGQFDYANIMHITGEFAGRLLIITLIATPIKLMFPKGRLSKWLVRNRRFFGVAAFAYTLLHTILYGLKYSLGDLASEFVQLPILTGWIAFFIFIPLAITSTNGAIRRMGHKKWKKLQRWVYLAGLLAFTHWALLGLQGPEGSMGGALVHLLPVLLLQAYRIWKQQLGKKKRIVSS